MVSPLASFTRVLATRAVEALGLGPELVDAVARKVRVPEPGLGDLALPCFELAKAAKQNPPDAARQVADALSRSGEVAKAEAVGPYVNVTFSTAALAGAVVPAARDTSYGTSKDGEGKTVVIDFSSPNIAKPLAFHHIRSTVIGAAIGRLHEARGFRVVGINYLGDWGKQFGLLATGFRRHGDPSKRRDAKHLVEVYVRANREADVEGRKEIIGAPAEARKTRDELAAARAELAAASADPKQVKKLEKRVASLAKRLEAMGGKEDGFDAWVATLEEKAAAAQAELPAVEARDREARLFFKSLEDGEPEALAEWKEFRETSVADFQKVYDRMGIRFFALEGESFYTKKLDAAIARVAQRPGTKESDGALIVDLPYKEGEPPVLLKTRDGTTLYVTRDIAAAIDRHERFAFERALYVVAADQSLHFDQLFRTLRAMGFPWAEKMKHVAFGRVHGMATRRGNVIFLDEVLDESVKKAREICEASEKIDKAHIEETIEAIGVGAIVFGDLRNLRGSDYTFRWEDVVNFDGLTGPYVQYTHARACSILRKGGGVPASADLSLLGLEEERAVMMALAAYPAAVEAACEQQEPSILTRAIIDVAQATASFLTAGNKDRSKRVLVEDDDAVKAARLQLVDAVRNTLARGLAILGVKSPEAM